MLCMLMRTSTSRDNKSLNYNVTINLSKVCLNALQWTNLHYISIMINFCQKLLYSRTLYAYYLI